MTEAQMRRKMKRLLQQSRKWARKARGARTDARGWQRQDVSQSLHDQAMGLWFRLHPSHKVSYVMVSVQVGEQT